MTTENEVQSKKFRPNPCKECNGSGCGGGYEGRCERCYGSGIECDSDYYNDYDSRYHVK